MRNPFQDFFRDRWPLGFMEVEEVCRKAGIMGRCWLSVVIGLCSRMVVGLYLRHRRWENAAGPEKPGLRTVRALESGDGLRARWV